MTRVNICPHRELREKARQAIFEPDSKKLNQLIKENDLPTLSTGIFNPVLNENYVKAMNELNESLKTIEKQRKAFYENITRNKLNI